MRRTSIVALACGGCVSVSGAQVIDWAAAVSGTWSTAANWNPADVPNTPAETARFNVNGTYAVSVDGTFSIASLQQTISNVTILINGGGNLYINGPTYNNRGLLNINPTSAGVETRLRFDGNTNITGNGVTQLSATQNRAIVDSNVGVTTVTNGVNHTFQGIGQIRSVLTNNGTVNANVSGNTLSLQVNGKTNNGLFLASNGGTLSIDAIAITQGASGLIQADGGTVNFTGTTFLSGGTVDGVTPSLVQIANGTSSWTNVTADGSVDIAGGANIAASGSFLDVNGTLRINPTNAGVETRLRFDNAAALGGVGEVVLAGTTNRAILDSFDAASIVTTSSDMHIRGFGQIRAGLVNNGRVTADAAGATLALQVHPKTNNGLMSAAPNGILEISTAITQDPLAEIRADSGTVRFLGGGSLTDGLLSSIDGGLVILSGSIPFDGVRTDSVLDISGGANLFVTNSLVNNGVITVNPSGAGVETRLRFDATGDLSGTGEVVLSAVENRAILETLPTHTLTVGADQEVRGMGQIRANLINNGTINADVPGNTLRLNTNGKTNNSAILVQDNCQMHLTGITITQSPAAFIEVDGGACILETAAIDGGQVRTLGDGVVRVATGSNTWRNVTFSGDADVNGGANLFITGAGLVNNGLIEVNPTEVGVETRFNFNESGVLSGTGAVRFGALTNRALFETAPGVTVTNAAPHLIAGRGEIRASLINESTIRADSAVSALLFNTNAKTNKSLMEAVNGGELFFQNVAITQGPAGLIRNDGSILRFRSAAVSGGTITTLNGGILNCDVGSNTIGNLTLNGAASVQGGVNLLLSGPVINNAVIDINPTNAGVETRLRFDVSSALAGMGEVRLSGSTNRAILESSAGVTGTLGAGQTLSGIGQTRGNFNLQGTLAPGFSAGTIDVVNGTITLADTTLYDFEVGGTATSQHDRFTGNATWNLDGTVTVTHIDGFTPANGNRFVIIQGSAVNGTFDELIAPDLGGVEWKLVYFSNKVELQVRCKADLSGSSDPNDPNYGVPDGQRDSADFFYYLDLFVAQDLRADLSGSSDPNDPSYGIKDGLVDASDFFFFLDIFAGVCN